MLFPFFLKRLPSCFFLFSLRLSCALHVYSASDTICFCSVFFFVFLLFFGRVLLQEEVFLYGEEISVDATEKEEEVSHSAGVVFVSPIR